MIYEVINISLYVFINCYNGYALNIILPTIIEIYLFLVIVSLYLVYTENGKPRTTIYTTMPPPYSMQPDRQVYPRLEEQVQVLTTVKNNNMV